MYRATWIVSSLADVSSAVAARLVSSHHRRLFQFVAIAYLIFCGVFRISIAGYPSRQASKRRGQSRGSPQVKSGPVGVCILVLVHLPSLTSPTGCTRPFMLLGDVSCGMESSIAQYIYLPPYHVHAHTRNSAAYSHENTLLGWSHPMVPSQPVMGAYGWFMYNGRVQLDAISCNHCMLPHLADRQSNRRSGVLL